MAISWGAWEGASPNRIRVGIDASWEAISNGEAVATCTIKIYTDVDGRWSDSQTLSYGGSISGSTSFSNTQDNNSVLRATRTYDYTYGANSYGTSPGTRTFSASLSGAFNGATPSKSVTVNIPARPIAAPAAPSSVGVTRVSDATTKVSWVNNADAGNPYETLTIQKSINGGAMATVTSPSGGTTSYSAATAANQKLRFQVRANNDAGSSSFVASGYIFTSPAVPTAPSRADIAGPGQRITWANTGMGYTEYVTEVIGYKNGVSVGVLGTVATGGVTFDHLTTHATQPYTTSDRWKYTVRHKTSSGTALYSAETAATTETAGITSPPLPPTGLDPNGGVIDPTQANAFTWGFNSTDSSSQQQFQIRRRLQGSGTWTTETTITSSATTWNLPANTYANGQVFEWQVRTRGAATTGGVSGDGFSDWSATATATAFLTKLIVPRWNVGMGEMAVDVSGYDWVNVGVDPGAPPFMNGWTNYSAPGTGYGYVRFCRRGGVVYIEGLVKTGTVNTDIFTLPVGFRPDQQLLISAIQSTFNTGAASAGTAHTHPISQSGGRLDIFPTGLVRQIGAATNGWQSVCCSFPADQ